MITFGSEAVTLYNRRESKDANGRTVVTWQRKELRGCFWTQRLERVRDSNSVVMTEVTVCKIPEDPAYRDPAEWDALADPTGYYFTLAPGDIIVKGVVSDAIGSSLTAAALVDKYKRSGVMTVTSVKNNAGSGYPLRHYLAKGA